MNLRISNALLASAAILVGGSSTVHAEDFSKAAPPASIPAFSTADIARTGFFYAGGQYVGAPGKGSDGRRRIRGSHGAEKNPACLPIVFLHGAGQTGTDWLQTPDGRPGWAYFFIKRGYVVYMVDYPARGRSATIPNADGSLTTARASNSSRSGRTSAEHGGIGRRPRNIRSGRETRPNKGKMGDPIFDDFAKTQVQLSRRRNAGQIEPGCPHRRCSTKSAPQSS